MCCLFNFLQYLFAFLHKAVTAFLCCVLAYAVCCVLLFAVTAGVALGYNYSVSEYMEHKDTNVSVQLQRGIFTDKGGGAAARRRSGGDGTGGDIGEELDSGYTNPKSSLRSHMQQLDAAENYERKLDELTSETYQHFQPIINYGTVNVDQLSSNPPQISVAPTRITNPAGFAVESTTENIDFKKESNAMLRTLIDRIKGAPAKDVMKIIGEEVAKKAFEQIGQNVSNYLMPLEMAMAFTPPSTTEEFDIGLDIAPLDIEMRSSSSAQSAKSVSDDSTPAPSQSSSVSDGPLTDIEDVSSDWKKKFYAAVARLKRTEAETQTPTKNKRNTKTKEKFMNSFFQDPSFVARIKSIPLVSYSVLQKDKNDHNTELDKRETNSEKDKIDKNDKTQPGVYVHRKNPNLDSRDDDGPAPSDEEFDYGDDEKSGQITVRKKRSALLDHLTKHNKTRIITTLINTIM